MKCIFEYFRRIAKKPEDQDTLVTFTRRCIPFNRMPHWKESTKTLDSINVHVDAAGRIEGPEGMGMLQVILTVSISYLLVF